MVSEQNSFVSTDVSVINKDKLQGILSLVKFRLTLTVAFSGFFGFLMGTKGTVDWVQLIFFLVGSGLITGAANTINQIIEKDLDKMMKRTKTRPLPTGLYSPVEAMLLAGVLIFAGTAMLLYFINISTAIFTLVSMALYAFVYTPLKQKSPISVLVGAFPGAFPPLIGWVAATGEFSMGGWILFIIQFIWQFPHFWAIAWIGSEDYSKAGFKMLPSKGGKNLFTAVHIMVYAFLLIPIGLLPFLFGVTGNVSAIIVLIAGFLFWLQTMVLIKEQSDKRALKVMLTSVTYLPLIQVAFLLDKI